jgi:hypothetical protein
VASAGNNLRSATALALADLLQNTFLHDVAAVTASMRAQCAAAAAELHTPGSSPCSSLSSSCDGCCSLAEGDGAPAAAAAAAAEVQERLAALAAAVAAVPRRHIELTSNPLSMAGARYVTSSALPAAQLWAAAIAACCMRTYNMLRVALIKVTTLRCHLTSRVGRFSCRIVWNALLELHALRTQLAATGALMQPQPQELCITDLMRQASRDAGSQLWLQDLCASAPRRRPPLGLRTISPDSLICLNAPAVADPASGVLACLCMLLRMPCMRVLLLEA